LERSVPAGRLKCDFISIRLDDGRALALRTPQGFKKSPIELPRAILDDYLRASLVRQDGPAREDGSIVFRLTEDGRVTRAFLAPQLRRLSDVGRDAYDRAPPILKFGNLAILEATRRASSFVSKFTDVRRPASSS